MLAWEMPWTEEPGRPQSMEPQRLGRDWMTEHEQEHEPKLTELESKLSATLQHLSVSIGPISDTSALYQSQLP